MKNKADKFNSGKSQWSLVHFTSLLPLVRVLEAGAAKYSRNNWMKGLTKEECLDSMQRHFIELKEGNEYDEDTGVHHIGGVLVNAMFYSFHHVKDVIKPGIVWVDKLNNLEKIYKNYKHK